MNQPTDPRPSATDLQFDKAEFADSSQHGSAAVAPSTTCAVCKQRVRDTYFTLTDNVICPRCRQAILAGQAQGSRIARVLMATLLGLGAGLLGAVIWYAVRKLTEHPLSIIAIAVGLMVGIAVRKGSQYRGGLGYQFLAVFLTYSAIAGNLMPDLFKALLESARNDRAAQSQPAATQPAATQNTDVEAAGTPATAPAASPPISAETARNLPLPLAIILLLLMVYAFAMYATIAIGFSSPIWLLIVGFALWEAWKINKKVALNFAGPFAVGPRDAGAAPPPLPGAGS